MLLQIAISTCPLLPITATFLIKENGMDWNNEQAGTLTGAEDKTASNRTNQKGVE